MKGVEVGVEYGEENFFIQKEEVEEVVSDFGYMPDSTPMRDINPGKIEELLENNAFIKDAEVYKELDGELHVDVEVRQPVLRIFNVRGQSAYIDEDGVIVPTSPKYTARAVVANGKLVADFNSLMGRNVDDMVEQDAHPEFKVISDLYHIAMYCRKSKLWKAQFAQFFVNENREIELIPRVGDHIVLVGNAENIDKKLNKLRLFYAEGLNKTGWNEYKTINLKFANQVVCSKE